MHYASSEEMRCVQCHGGESGGDDARKSRPSPAGIAVAEHNGEQRRDHDGGAARCDEGDIGEETEGKAEQHRYGWPSGFAPALASRADEPKGANQENTALKDVVFRRHAIRFDM